MRIHHSAHYPADHQGSLDEQGRPSSSLRKSAMVVGWFVFMGALVYLVYAAIVFLMPPALYE
ncbi:MAG: hypothetical protein ACYC9S_11495 [Leptospirales bacterium]